MGLACGVSHFARAAKRDNALRPLINLRAHWFVAATAIVLMGSLSATDNDPLADFALSSGFGCASRQGVSCRLWRVNSFSALSSDTLRADPGLRCVGDVLERNEPAKAEFARNRSSSRRDHKDARVTSRD